MEKKARIGRSALLIIGIIYTALGGTFVILGVALAALLRDSDAFMVGLIFGYFASSRAFTSLCA